MENILDSLWMVGIMELEPLHIILESNMKENGLKAYFHGLGSITYPDGIQYEGQWNVDQPGCMDCFIF